MQGNVICRRIMGLNLQKRLLWPNMVLVHSNTCPTQRRNNPCGSPGLKRREATAPVRYGFIPENWFVFFYPITGVSGPYLLGIGLINYWLSKEIFVMEHEYYTGLSIALIVYLGTTRFGPSIGKSLDSGVDAIQKELEQEREDEKNFYMGTIKAASEAQMRAKGQNLLMDAKKENIAMQLEAVYRERLMHVYHSTKGRMDYHLKRYRAETKIQHKWMIEWILQNVRKSITPEFEQQALDAAIQDLAAVAGKA